MGVLYVPEYQRDYAWEIKEEIDEFCMDLETCVNENCKDYFLGQIVRKIISDRTAISICEEIRKINDEQFEEKFVAFCVKSPSTAQYILREIGNHIQNKLSLPIIEKYI